MAAKKIMSTVVGVRFTDDQYALHAEAIAASGLKPARYFGVVLSRSSSFEESAFDRTRMLQVFEKAGHALNRVAHLANSAPYKGALYQIKHLHWLSRLTSI